MAKSAVNKEFQVSVDDLMVSVQRNKVVLRSKKFNKIIVPHLSTAHNYSYNALPIYQFLCDIQTQGKRPGFYFTPGQIVEELFYQPRIVYQNIILSPANWKITKKDLEPLLKIQDDNALIEALTQYRKKNNIPERVQLSDGDNDLYINLTNPVMVRTLFSVVKNRTFFKLEEFLYDEKNPIATSNEETYNNQFILCFYKDIINK